MSDFSLCLGCPFDDPDYGCLRSDVDECRLCGVTHDDARSCRPDPNTVLQEDDV